MIKIASRTKRFWRGQVLPVSRLWSSQPNYTGLVMSSEWTNPGSLAIFSTESYLRADTTKADPRRDTRATSKPTSNGQEFNRRNWRLPQPIDLDGKQLSRALLETSSTTAVCVLQQLRIAVKEQQTPNHNWWHTMPDLCPCVCASMASNHQLILCFVNVILKFKRQPIMIHCEERKLST